MKKIFLLIPVLALALVANADVIEITPTSPEPADNLRLALNNANDGDEIVMAAGTYVESNGDYIAFTGKHVTVRAAEGAEVLIQPQVPITVSGGGCAHFENVKIDASHLNDIQSWYEHIIYATDAAVNNRIILEGCEIYNFALNKSLIWCSSSNALDALTINNCYFHNINKSCVFIENTSNSIAISITNSTFANITTDAGSYYAGVIDTRATSGSFLVDHCTFYNVEAMSTGYAAIGQVKLASGATVSNCIFALSASGAATNRTIRDKVTATNCLVYNYTTDSNYGMQSDVTKTGCFIANPLFANAANGDFSFNKTSPAYFAGTNWSHLGDPRWFPAEPAGIDLPASSADAAVTLNNANIEAKHSAVTCDGDGFYDMTYASDIRWTAWIVNINPLVYDISAFVSCTTGWHPDLYLYDLTTGTEIASRAEEYHSATETEGASFNLGEWDLTSVEAGKYLLVVKNNYSGSTLKLKSLTFSYSGGAVQNMPGTTNINDAWFSAEGTRDGGMIDFPDGHIQDGWVKWNVSFASAANYNVTLNVNSDNCKNYTVALVDANDANVVTPLTLNDCDTKGTAVALSMGAMEVPAGNYILKVTNATENSDAQLLSVQFAYAGGATIDLSKTTPASLLANADAIHSDDWAIEGGKITHAESTALTGWAKWNVDCADAANYNVTVNISSDNGHLMKVEVFEDENNSAIHTLNETSATQYHTGDQAINLGNIALEDKEYVFKVSNTGEYSHVQIASIVITYVGGAVVNIPNANIPLVDAIRSTRAFIDEEGLHFTDAENLGTISGEWAKWNIHVASEGLYKFTAHCSSTNYSNLTIAVYDGETELYTYTPQYTYNQADKEISSPEWLLGAGNYVLKLSNPANHSNGYLLSLSASVADNIIILDEMATDNSVIHANNGVNTKKILLKRTFKGGMYNTICLPFSDWNSSLELVFGAGYELLELESTELVGDELDLNFSAVTELGHGRPYLIKPEQDVVNPIFGTGHTIDERTDGYNVKSCTNADFIGSFIKGEVPAGEDNLFLGPNNLLYFSDVATPIKGMRAWFQVKGVPNPSLVIKRANIVTKKDGTTDVEIVNSQEVTKSQKLLRDGQLIIIRDGVQYNVMGVKLQ